ncbi:MAG TPA: dihydroorotate dehydrogenase-like protein [Planctomycetota bacterium]|jgi:dihydroorotate dehydrogenase (fumarate)
MDLSTTYLGFKLANPLIVASGPLVDDIDTVKRLEDSGAAAIVMHSLFEEQLTKEALGTIADIEAATDTSAEARSYFPLAHEFRLGPEPYLEQIRKIKKAISIPVIASLNGITPSGWLKYSEEIQEAGADGLELNVYYLPTDPAETSGDVEGRVLECIKLVKKSVTIPIAVKLSPFYSSLMNLACSIDSLGAQGLVLFNRVYQPEIDAELLNVVAKLQLSTSAELPLRLRWLGILFGRIKANLAVTGGVHTGLDAVKSIMAGADAVQVLSALLQNGPTHLKEIRKGMVEWMEEHQYNSIKEMRGSLSLKHCPDPSGYERGNYARVLQSWRG